MKEIDKIVEAECPKWATGKIWGRGKLTLEELMEDSKSFHHKNPIICLLQGDDGSEHHSVSLYDGWIFDDIEEYAMKLCPENIDKCCGDDTTRFKSFVYAKQYKKSYGKKRQRRMEQRLSEKKQKTKNTQKLSV